MTTVALTPRPDEVSAAPSGEPPVAMPEPAVAPRSRPRGRFGLLVASIALVGLGASFLVVSTVAPDAVDRVTGDIKVTVQKQFQQIFAPDALPILRLGGEGGLAQLDECDGTFTEMISYRVDGVPPLFAAHNNCGGDIILGWDLGQRVRVEGSDIVYEVVEERHTPKWSDVEALVGMSGEFMVQTCFYGENRMRFLALAQVDPQPRTH
ncbi:hypothetical protein [Microbacterium sp. UFMG61]|uniref:hypothetical protein n=1 Tax=Microbacterium sp. UFMG61 TaxID=2745935 RepID=UPI00188F8541|nr:hypothetical protein [Microbacterium sp. UFMG61]